MNVFSEPRWIKKFQFKYQGFDEVPGSVFDSINSNLDRILSDDPLVSVVVAAWNEEINILRSIASLSMSTTTIPFEIIVVDNNSTDNTAKTLDRLHVKKVFQPLQGCGPARQLGMEMAKGKYILMADADGYYPQTWIDEMIRALQKKGVACVNGRYAFISASGYPRWKLFLLEQMKYVIAGLRQFKRPYLNGCGMSMGFYREQGLKVGFVMRHIRGEDGRMCFDLMQFGRVELVRSGRAVVWTNPRALQRDGSFSQALGQRIIKEIKRFSSLFVPLAPHDTKTSTND